MRGKKHKEAQGDGIWEAAEEETAQTTPAPPWISLNASPKQTSSSTGHGPLSQPMAPRASSLTGVFEALHHPNEPQGHGGGQQRSLWNPPENGNEVRKLCHSNLLVLGADGHEGELTGSESHAGDPQDPSHHEDEKDFVAPKC